MSNHATLLLDLEPAVGGHGARGIGRYVRGLVAAVDAFDDDLRQRVWAYGPASPAVAAFETRGIVVPRLLRPSGVPSWLSSRAYSSWAMRRAHATVLHSTDPHRPWAPRSRASAVTVYDLIPLREPGLLASLRPDHRWMYGRYLKQVRAATRVIAISRTTADDVMERLGIPEARIDVVYPVVLAPEPAQRVAGHEPVIIVVGALDRHKRPLLALEAFAIFRRNTGAGRLRYIGPADPENSALIIDRVLALDLDGLVTVEGRVSDATLEDAYAQAAVLLMTSRVEGFGLPAVEAVVRGVPVVAVDTMAARETLTGAGIIVPADADEIARAIENASAPDPMTIAATRERFSLAGTSRALAAGYRQMVD